MHIWAQLLETFRNRTLAGRSAVARPARPSGPHDPVRARPRFLLLTSELGCGHARAARAIETALLKQAPHAQVQVLDWWSLMNPGVAQAAKSMYLRLVQEQPELYERIYHAGERTWRDLLSGAPLLSSPMQRIFDAIATLYDSKSLGPLAGPYASDRALFSLFCTAGQDGTALVAGGVHAKLALIKWSWTRLVRRMDAAILEFRPDAIVSTQMIPAALVSAVKQRRGLTVPSIAVPTDFGVHDFWNQSGTDGYCLSHESLADLPAMLDKQKIRVTGMPLMPEFEYPLGVAEARRQLQLPMEIPTVLVLGGGLGLGVDAVTERLLQSGLQIQCLVLTGRNLPARDRLAALAARFPGALRVYDWTEHVQRFIRAADVVVGKPGGLTVAEVLACGRPLFATRTLRGQEGFNVHFLEKCRVGGLLTDGGLTAQIEGLLSRPAELASLQARAWSLGRRMGAKRIAALALAMAAGKTAQSAGTDLWHVGSGN